MKPYSSRLSVIVICLFYCSTCLVSCGRRVLQHHWDSVMRVRHWHSNISRANTKSLTFQEEIWGDKFMSNSSYTSRLHFCILNKKQQHFLSWWYFGIRLELEEHQETKDNTRRLIKVQKCHYKLAQHYHHNCCLITLGKSRRAARLKRFSLILASRTLTGSSHSTRTTQRRRRRTCSVQQYFCL